MEGVFPPYFCRLNTKGSPHLAFVEFTLRPFIKIFRLIPFFYCNAKPINHTMTQNPQLDLAYNFVQFTDKHIFLTGKAGTGKTNFLQNLKKLSLKRMAVAAPTGVTPINAGG